MSVEEAFKAMIDMIPVCTNTSGPLSIKHITAEGRVAFEGNADGIFTEMPDQLKISPKILVVTFGNGSCNFKIYDDPILAAEAYENSAGKIMVATITHSK